MTEATSPYQTPNSTIEVAVESTSEPLYFTCSTLKLSVMSLVTFGIYDLYWFYKNWNLVRRHTGEGIMPFFRAIFSHLWSYSLFNRIRKSAQEKQLGVRLPAGLLAIAFFLMNVVASRLAEPYWLVAFFSFICLLPANQAAIEINRGNDERFVNNESFSGWNWVGIVLGTPLLVFTVMPLEQL